MNFVDQPALAPPVTRPAFVGDGGRFVKLLSKGGLLQLVTLGFYRFWLLTDIRRHLWSATSAGGDALEYTGRGRELLIGFLFALAVLAPFFLAYFLVGIEAERYKAFASAPLYFVLFVFGQFAVYRARRYRLTRTVWRGVRFWMTGSGFKYALRSGLWTIAVLLTLGLALPWRSAALERYKMRNTRYGDLQGAFVGTGWGLFKSVGLLWLFGFLCLAALGLVIADSVHEAATFGGDAAGKAAAAKAILPALVAVSLLALVVFGLAWPFYLAAEWRWWLRGVRIGDVSFDSAFPRLKILTLYLKFLGVSSLVGAGIGGAAAPLIASYSAAEIEAHKVVFTVLGIIGYLALLLAYGVVYRYYMQHQLWRAAVDTLTIRNLESAAHAVGEGTASTAFGEGLLDGLDMAGF